ncbi:MAG TPA: proteasome subunit alpha [Actinomycetota bacterium]|nr:proteasome subunit alpha [Actinomycetota bacterium]
MSFQPYVPPEQLIKDRSEYARKGIAKGRSVVAMEYADGILFLAENPSATLHKISEIYDRIAFAGVGRYSEFEDLRIAGVRLADLRGYSYGREDVTAKTVANAYAQALNNIFTTQMKPYEVEILVGQVGDSPAENELFHILYDGSVTDEKGYVAMGGRSEDLAGHLRDDYREGFGLEEAVRMATTALSKVESNSVEAEKLGAEKLEAAVLDRSRGRRTFRRLTDQDLSRIAQA